MQDIIRNSTSLTFIAPNIEAASSSGKGDAIINPAINGEMLFNILIYFLFR